MGADATKQSLRLKSYTVRNFRSVDDSGPIEVDGVTALIGTNESGKTNLLLPLWKFKPAKDGALVATADYPRKHYNDFRSLEQKPEFIEVLFGVPEDLAEKLAKMTGFPPQMFSEVSLTKYLDKRLTLSFPQVKPEREISSGEVTGLFDAARNEVDASSPLPGESEAKTAMLCSIDKAKDFVRTLEIVEVGDFGEITKILTIAEGPAVHRSTIAPRFARLRDDLQELAKAISKPHPNSNDEARKLAASRLPSFVYYSNYGNLDSEIYLPHVIENMKREGLGSKEAAKARTLKVLFEFVGLKAEEILELGCELKEPPAGKELTNEEIQAVSERKKERSILLQSAGSKLTSEFRNWWKQGNYRFRFEADGDHFRIWVSDDLRPEEVELEGRSTGLQWFLSFYLVFLVESRDSHAGAILLLDEPGLSLHPLAQQDLTGFFDGLAETNQILYTTHSPFMIDSDRLDRARKVYIADDGTSKVSADLQFQGTEKTRRAAGYTVWSALGIAVAESFLNGCKPVIVEGPSDQHYLTAIKLCLIRAGKIKPARELVFPPAGGAKGVKAVASMVMAKAEKLPQALFDADSPGLETMKQLKESLYANDSDQLICVNEFVSLPSAETEDLFPPDLIARAVDSVFRSAEKPFGDVVKPGTVILPQIEAWAKSQEVKLELGWKVELAKRVKQRLLDGAEVDEKFVAIWEQLFNRFSRENTAAEAAAE